jgi:hypothetical protein
MTFPAFTGKSGSVGYVLTGLSDYHRIPPVRRPIFVMSLMIKVKPERERWLTEAPEP